MQDDWYMFVMTSLTSDGPPAIFYDMNEHMKCISLRPSL